MAGRNKIRKKPVEVGLMLQHPLFAALEPSQRERLLPLIQEVTLQPHDLLIAEGQAATKLWVLLGGQVSVTRHERGGEVILTQLGPGALVGENALVAGRKAMATVVADSEGAAACLDLEALKSHPDQLDLWQALLEGAVYELTMKLEEAGVRSLDHYRWQLSQFQTDQRFRGFTWRSLLFVGLSSLCLGLMGTLPLGIKGLLMTLLMLFCALATAGFVRKSVFPAAWVNLSQKQSWGMILQALQFSLPFVLLLVLSKPWLQVLFPADIRALLLSLHAPGPFAVLLSGLAVFCLAQEYVMRRGMQATLQSMLAEHQATPWLGILITQFLFTAAYVPLGPVCCGLIFLPGLFWGWLFERQQTWVGVGFSHVLIVGFACWLGGS